MYKKEELFKKISGHIQDKDIGLVEALVKDVDEFNEKYCDSDVELYIDFDDVGNDSEFDPYETFSVKMHAKTDNDIKFTPVVVSGLSLTELDCALYGLMGYFGELEEVKKRLVVEV